MNKRNTVNEVGKANASGWKRLDNSAFSIIYGAVMVLFGSVLAIPWPRLSPSFWGTHLRPGNA